jgi:hypothetical protein
LLGSLGVLFAVCVGGITLMGLEVFPAMGLLCVLTPLLFTPGGALARLGRVLWIGLAGALGVVAGSTLHLWNLSWGLGSREKVLELQTGSMEARAGEAVGDGWHGTSYWGEVLDRCLDYLALHLVLGSLLLLWVAVATRSPEARRAGGAPALALLVALMSELPYFVVMKNHVAIHVHTLIHLLFSASLLAAGGAAALGFCLPKAARALRITGVGVPVLALLSSPLWMPLQHRPEDATSPASRLLAATMVLAGGCAWLALRPGTGRRGLRRAGLAAAVAGLLAAGYGMSREYQGRSNSLRAVQTRSNLDLLPLPSHRERQHQEVLDAAAVLPADAFCIIISPQGTWNMGAGLSSLGRGYYSLGAHRLTGPGAVEAFLAEEKVRSLRASRPTYLFTHPQDRESAWYRGLRGLEPVFEARFLVVDALDERSARACTISRKIPGERWSKREAKLLQPPGWPYWDQNADGAGLVAASVQGGGPTRVLAAVPELRDVRDFFLRARYLYPEHENGFVPAAVRFRLHARAKDGRLARLQEVELRPGERREAGVRCALSPEIDWDEALVLELGLVEPEARSDGTYARLVGLDLLVPGAAAALPPALVAYPTVRLGAEELGSRPAETVAVPAAAWQRARLLRPSPEEAAAVSPTFLAPSGEGIFLHAANEEQGGPSRVRVEVPDLARFRAGTLRAALRYAEQMAGQSALHLRFAGRLAQGEEIELGECILQPGHEGVVARRFEIPEGTALEPTLILELRTEPPGASLAFGSLFLTGLSFDFERSE